ncbi:MAG: hypothetical protein Q7V63_06400 [Gammaproteobacteria bacterium]|nr:hypothetical protein [Gammaproteobacteria bacterium]
MFKAALDLILKRNLEELDILLSSCTALTLNRLRTSTNSDGWNLLHSAVYSQQTTIAELLIHKYKFDCNLLSEAKSSPLDLACDDGNIDLIMMLLSLTKPKYWPQALQSYVRFLEEFANIDEIDITQRRNCHLILRAFATNLKLYELEIVLKAFTTLWKEYQPAAKTLFRAYLSKMEEIYLVNNPIKSGCPRLYISTKRKLNFATIEDALKRHLNAYERPSLMAEYSSRKDKKIKYSIELGEEHLPLKADLFHTSAGNLIAASMSFIIKITDGKDLDDAEIADKSTARAVYHKITVPVFIPDGSGTENTSRNFDDIIATVVDPYGKLKELYQIGLTQTGGCKHGERPDYDHPDTGMQATVIKHTEQALAAFLSSASGVYFVMQQLIKALRDSSLSPANLGDSIKIISVFLHLHSNKTPCMPCEHVLIGLSKKRDLGFIGRLEQELKALNKEFEMAVPSRYFRFTVPKTGITLHPIFSADSKDGGHRTALSQIPTTSISSIAMRSPSYKVHCSVFKKGLVDDYTDFKIDRLRSVILSGGASSEKKRKNKSRIAGMTINSLSGLAVSFSKLFTNSTHFSGLKEVDIIGDGNCLFRAIARAIEGNQDNYAVYRSNVVHYLRNNEATMLPFFAGNASEYHHYLDNMARNRVWGDMLEVYAAARVYNRPMIIVYLDRNQAPDLINATGVGEPIFLGYEYGRHYTTLVHDADTGLSIADIMLKVIAKREAVAKDGKLVVDIKSVSMPFCSTEIKPSELEDLELQHALNLSLVEFLENQAAIAYSVIDLSPAPK